MSVTKSVIAIELLFSEKIIDFKDSSGFAGPLGL